MLLGNYTLLNKNPGIELNLSNNPRGYWKDSTFRRFYIGDAVVPDQTAKASIPNGYLPPYTLLLAPKSGSIATTAQTTKVLATLTGSMAAGKNLQASLTGSGFISNATVQLVVSMVASLSGSGTITNAQAVAILQMVANINANANITASLTALARITANIIAGATMSPQMNATANMEADITPFTTLSPESLAASVWNSVATEYNASGTMGEKVNAAGTAGDPWTADLTPYNTPDTAGKVLKDAKAEAALAKALSA